MRGDPVVCRSCGHENSEGSRFCADCGHSLATGVTCSSCGQGVPAGSKFCNRCGTPVAAAPQAVPELPDDLAWKINAGRAALEGERKQITVLFADVRGSMDLAERLDPESWRDVMNRLFQVLADAVHRADGTVDKFTGDGIMALFGAPVAREDHAQRACWAALDMIDGVSALAAEMSDENIDLAVRIGLNSGEVVVGSIGEEGRMDYTAVGHTVGLAQRMESQADPGTAHMTAHTAGLVEGFFELIPLGERQVKGASAPLTVFRLQGAGTAHGHLDVSRTRGLSSFVGREDEVSELRAAFARSQAGVGEVIGIVAPAGVGKSRLCQEFADGCRERGIRIYEAQCEAHTREIPLVPVLQMLRSRFGIAATDSDAEARDRIRSELVALDADLDTAEDLELVYDFLGVRASDAPEILMKGDARNRRLRDLVRRLVQATNRDPSVVLIEDLQWVDPASAMFLETLVEAVPASGGLVVATFRPEFRAGWMSGSHYRQIPLTALPQDALEALLGELLGSGPSLDGLSELIAERTGGNPLYVEEIVRELDESGTLDGERGAYRMAREIDELPVPPTVQTIIAARIDRLTPEAKVALQTAAAIGTETGRGLLSAVVDLDDEGLNRAIRALIESEFLHETALYPEQILAFRHPLTQEIAYGSQLAQARVRAHTAIAKGLEATDPERADENAGMIAQHYGRAGDAMKAAEWHLRAIGWAGLRDPRASIRHALQIVDLDDDIPNDAGDAARLTARLYVTSMGWRVGADPAVIRTAYNEGVSIARRLGDDTTLTLLHASFAACPVTCEGRLHEGFEIAMEAVRLADDLGDPGLRALVRTFPSYCLWLQLRLDESMAMCEEIMELTEGDPEIPFADLVGSPRAWAFMARGSVLCARGRLEEGHRAIEAAISYPYGDEEETLGWAHMFAATVHMMGGDVPTDVVAEHARIAFEIAERLGDAFSRIWARYWVAYADLVSGNLGSAVEHFDRALREIENRGAGRESLPGIHSGLGSALVASGEVERGIEFGRTAVRLATDQQHMLFELGAREALALSLLERRHDGDVSEATEHLRIALANAERTGHELFADRLRTIAEDIGSPA